MEFLTAVKTAYSKYSKIHIILDNASYNTSKEVLAFALENNIYLHHLPTYSPNLNAIERLWPVMNERIRNNVFFASAKEFKRSIKDFYEETVHQIKDVLRTRVTDNFRVIKAVS